MSEEKMTSVEKVKAITDLLNTKAFYPRFVDEIKKGETKPRLAGSVELSVLDDKEIAYLKNLAILIIERDADNGIMAAKREEIQKQIKNQEELKAKMAEEMKNQINNETKQ